MLKKISLKVVFLVILLVVVMTSFIFSVCTVPTLDCESEKETASRNMIPPEQRIIEEQEIRFTRHVPKV